MSPSTPYLFCEIWVPKRAPYNHPDHGWPSIVGDFVVPLAEYYPRALIWQLREGAHWQLCFAAMSDEESRLWSKRLLDEMNSVMRRIARERGFHIKRYIRNSTLGGALGGTRWMPRVKQGTKAEGKRSLLLAQACHAVCAIYRHTLVQKGRGKNRHWEVEAPQCTKQNPHGNLFESFMHLVANTTGAQFDVLVQARTRWMHEGWKEAKLTCHL